MDADIVLGFLTGVLIASVTARVASRAWTSGAAQRPARRELSGHSDEPLYNVIAVARRSAGSPASVCLEDALEPPAVNPLRSDCRADL